jgi:hypothetical protein
MVAAARSSWASSNRSGSELAERGARVVASSPTASEIPITHACTFLSKPSSIDRRPATRSAAAAMRLLFSLSLSAWWPCSWRHHTIYERVGAIKLGRCRDVCVGCAVCPDVRPPVVPMCFHPPIACGRCFAFLRANDDSQWRISTHNQKLSFQSSFTKDGSLVWE